MKNKILFVLSLLMGLLFINGGVNKIFRYMPMPENMPEAIMKDFEALKEIVWLIPLIAVAEILGGILIIIPKTRALGALVLFPVVVGIVLTHFLVETSGIPMSIIISAILGWIIFENRNKYLYLLK